MTPGAALDKLDRIQIALNALRWEFRRGNVDFESADMREFLLAAYDLTEIDAIYETAQEIFIAEPEPSRPVCVLDYTR